VRSNRVVHDGRGDLSTPVGQEGLQDAAVLGILLALHETTLLQGGQRELHALGADEQAARQFGARQAGFVRQLAQHADLGGTDTVIAHGLVDRRQREVERLLEQPQDVVGEFDASHVARLHA
jgi:hypothetical protein